MSFSLSQSSISLEVKSMAIGLTLYWPAYFGADPCVGSNTHSCHEVCAGREAKSADKTGAQVADDVAEHVFSDQHE